MVHATHSPHPRSTLTLIVALILAALFGWPVEAAAFCGFYVSNTSDEALVNEATTVILMRDGTRTVLSMQNNYRGPASDFAMVIPVPVVLAKSDVKVLEPSVFDRVDQMSAPRLVEYWELDPCYIACTDSATTNDVQADENPLQEARPRKQVSEARAAKPKVVVEARFAVGEYAIEVLSAEESLGLERWLVDQGYNIPANAAEHLEPYVQAGSRFFVAKVRAERARFDDEGRVQLSPLRIHYDSDAFSLPIRLGLINAEGPQDLVVHILAPSMRYETSNYDTVPIPTNVEVLPGTAERFQDFYGALFDRTQTAHPGAVVLEYAWGQPNTVRKANNGKCDPCPPALPALPLDDLVSLGMDRLPLYRDGFRHGRVDQSLASQLPGDFVHTRMHIRYEPGDRVEDLVFHSTGAAYGGTPSVGEYRRAGLSRHGGSRFQARYVIRHPWQGKIRCDNPIRGRWTGTPRSEPPAEPIDDANGVQLASFIRPEELDAIDEHLGLGALPKIQVDPELYAPPKLVGPGRERPERVGAQGGCGHCALDEDRAPGAGLVGSGLLALLLLIRRREEADHGA